MIWKISPNPSFSKRGVIHRKARRTAISIFTNKTIAQRKRDVNRLLERAWEWEDRDRKKVAIQLMPKLGE